ncbi:MAG: aminomethyl-transferring glycine dehydrogenase subunit GcvPA [Sporolactobacillus sp.]
MSGFRYLPVTDANRREMLQTIGVKDDEQLFRDIPSAIRFNGKLAVEQALSEPELIRFFKKLAAKNITMSEYPSFLGAGVYDHYIPAVVDSVLSRGEFFTAYTPYQAEVSQGELQAIFEFQTMICELTGMAIANSSMYDASTALAEAALLSAGATRKKKLLVSETVHPEYRDVLATYAHGRQLEVVTIPEDGRGRTDLDALRALADSDTACVINQYPNFFGQIEPLQEIEKIVHGCGKAQFIVSSDPLALGLLTPPGAFNADIVTGDCQPLGITSSFGGPHCGYFAATEKLMRKVPGRLVGQTVDEQGQRGYVLTLQAREQHIRRDKATSNICSNQALNALASAVAMSALGKTGLTEMARQNLQKAHYAAEQLKENGISFVTMGSFFNEFVIDCGMDAADLSRQLLEKGFIAGCALGRFNKKRQNHMLICVTEMRTKNEIDEFVRALGGIIHD